jgi:predicted outer membrane lipoprotein
MTRRELLAYLPAPTVVLRGRPNWTTVLFFVFLAAMHLLIAVPALMRSRWDGYLSLTLGAAFGVVTAIAYCCRTELMVLARERTVRVRTGLRSVAIERHIRFCEVKGVRLTMTQSAPVDRAQIDLVCENEDVRCPPTSIPRQQALYLALTIGAPLVKVLGTDVPSSVTVQRLNGLLPH